VNQVVIAVADTTKGKNTAIDSDPGNLATAVAMFLTLALKRLFILRAFARKSKDERPALSSM